MKRYLQIFILCAAMPCLLQAQGDDPTPEVIIIGNGQILNCTSNPATIGVSVQPWREGFSYLWSTGQTDSVILVKPSATRVYEVTISNPEINFTASRAILVKVKNEPVIATANEITIDKHTCPGTSIELQAAASGGHGMLSYMWNNGAQGQQISVKPTETTTFQYTVTDVCGTTASSHVSVRFENHDPLVAPTSAVIPFDCESEVLEISATLDGVHGGVGHGYTYSFDNWANEKTALRVSPEDGATYLAEITDACGIQKIVQEISLDKRPIEIPTLESIMVCEGSEATITKPGDGFYYWDGTKMHTAYNAKVEKSTSFDLVFSDRCGKPHQATQQVVVDKVDAYFNYDVDHFERSVSLMVSDYESANTYVWSANGKEIGSGNELGTALGDDEQFEIRLEATNPRGCTNSTVRSFKIREEIAIPSAITPNGDGQNDVFRVSIPEPLASFNIKIFDRWGQLVYESNDQYFEWDGGKIGDHTPVASFAYVLKGKSLSGRLIESNGTITTLTRK